MRITLKDRHVRAIFRKHDDDLRKSEPEALSSLFRFIYKMARYVYPFVASVRNHVVDIHTASTSLRR